nr:MAG TPA: hypothetical protein [Caudoviricetes sp.]
MNNQCTAVILIPIETCNFYEVSCQPVCDKTSNLERSV